MPLEVEKYYYRKHFNLSAQEMADEPIKEFFTNCFIIGQIEKKQAQIQKAAKRGIK